MAHTHVLLEVYCGYEYRIDKTTKVPEYCTNGVNKPGYHCFENECPFKSYTPCPYEISFTGKCGEVKDDSYIGFGGEMEPNNYDELEKNKLLALWEKVCKNKLDEAYDEYMILKKDVFKDL